MTPEALATDAQALGVTIAALAARFSKVPVAVIEPDTPLSVLGLDSLATIELGAELEDALGIDLPPELLTDCDDVRSIATRIAQHRNSLGRGGSRPVDPFDLMLADSILPADVIPQMRSGPHAMGLDRAGAVLLTGATGFLGSHIAAALIERSNATLHCIVRPGARSATRRLHDALCRIGVDARVCKRRLRVIEADLTRPSLGLGPRELEAFASQVDAVCHAAATVNWVYSYSALRTANVWGTLELLRLASSRGIPFHFVSSLSVCYSTLASREVDETLDPLVHIRGVHLGYAQSKIVAEALVRGAGERGLPVSIYRPSLIAGDSRNGAFNAGDLLSVLVAGCVRMGTAPDLDWSLDCVPVDLAARGILELSAEPPSIFHLVHPRPRHWRECLLWMHLYGYPIRLLPLHEWLRQLERETDTAHAEADSHPLRHLRRFFLDTPAGARGLTLPELYEDVRRARAVGLRTSDLLSKGTETYPPLDAALLECYFNAFIGASQVPPPQSRLDRPAPLPPAPFDEAFFARMFAHDDCVSVRQAIRLGSGSVHSIVSELTAWRTARPSGLHRYRLHLETADGPAERDVIVKVKPRDTEVLAVGEAVAALCDERVGAAYARWRVAIGFTSAHLRETAIYQQRDPRFTAHAPALLGSAADEGANEWVLVLEYVTDAIVKDAVDDTRSWSAERIDVALQGLASLHAIWYGRDAALREMPWIGHVQTAGVMSEMTELWSSLQAHASGMFSAWGGRAMPALHQRLIDTIPQWWRVLDESPRTLIHNDFNPRNICLRPGPAGLRLCAYDWELATVGAPQRDLAELLCFVLPPDAPAESIDWWIGQHRRALAAEAGVDVCPTQWRDGFRSALYDVLINRLSMYALVHRIRPQRFLPRIVATWRHLYDHFPLDGTP